MKVKIPIKVTGVREANEWYPQTGKYIQADLTVMENELNITGNIVIRENLQLGQCFSIIINTNETMEVTKIPNNKDLEVK